ncbi:MAG: hypothetical protein CMO77_06860 [Verrucomicrobiales bacterium]|nr:hypothetical protein [Verrucomicrobiales bacterium]|tara:strand:+ start:518 stop:1027 length:510 start_codon:yes stop_codon:yes gene_type:complete
MMSIQFKFLHSELRLTIVVEFIQLKTKLSKLLDVFCVLLEFRTPYTGEKIMIYLGIIYGLALVVLGIFGYIKSDMASVTALIPAFLGAPVFVLSLFSMNPKFLMIGMHINVVVALAGFIATSRDTFGFISGQEFDNQLAVYSKAITCVLSLIFIIFSVASFIKARKAKK